MTTAYKKIAPAVLMTLKDALVAVYWFKNDLRRFLEYTIKNKAIISTLNWDEYKINIVSDLIDRMVARQDIYQDDLLALIEALSNVVDYSHLKRCEDAAVKIKNAKNAIEALKKQSAGHLSIKDSKEKAEKRQTEYLKKIQKSNSFDIALQRLKGIYVQSLSNTNPQKRGFQLEVLMKELFDLFDLDPKASFKNQGEQIDGSFSFDGHDYLAEMKWHAKPTPTSDIDVFAAKISSKMKLTLGSMISINGFSAEALSLNRELWKSIILMDGQDLFYVLDGKIDLKHLMYRKRRHAAETGNIYLRVTEII